VFVVLPRWHTAVEGRRWHEAEKTREQIKQWCFCDWKLLGKTFGLNSFFWIDIFTYLF
jgi:hypothetical protein